LQQIPVALDGNGEHCVAQILTFGDDRIFALGPRTRRRKVIAISSENSTPGSVKVG
jgi:hypothetical protein